MAEEVGVECAKQALMAPITTLITADKFENVDSKNNKTTPTVSKTLLDGAVASIKAVLEKLIADDAVEDGKKRKYLLEGGRRRRSASKKASKKASKAKAPKAAKKASKKRTKRSSKK